MFRVAIYVAIALVISVFAVLSPARAQFALAPNVYVTSPNGTITKISTSVFSAVTSFSTSFAFGGALTVSPDGSTLYATTIANSVVAINANTGATIATIPLPAAPGGIAVAPDGGRIFVTLSGTSTAPANGLAVIDTPTNSVAGIITVGNEPIAVAITPDGRKLYVANVFDNSISVVDTRTGAVKAPIIPPDFFSQPSKLSTTSQGLAISPDGTTLYIGTTVFDVAILDTTTDTFTGTVDVGLAPSGGDSIAFSPDGKTAYVTVFSTAGATPLPPSVNVLVVIDTATATVTNQISLPQLPSMVLAPPDGGNILVTGAGAAAVDLVLTSTNAFSSALPLPSPAAGGAAAIAWSAAPPLVASDLPSGRSVQVGATATIFATIVSAVPSTLDNCTIGLRGPLPAGLSVSFQTTDPTTNQPTGQVNQPVSLNGRGSQSFLVAMTSTSPQSLQAEPLSFICDGIQPSPVIEGVNTVDLSFSATPVADMIAESATISGRGVVSVPLSKGQAGAFALASANVGVGDTLTVSADTGSAALPLSITICQTNPATSQCLARPAPTVTTAIAANAEPTFSLFVEASAPIALNPATNRIFVRFSDQSGNAHGSTSVAVETD